MTADNSEIIEKLKKILALAERGGTEEEAANAANMAAALALKYGIDLAAVQTAGMTAPRGFKYSTIFEDKGGFEQWLINLAGGIVAQHGGKIFYQTAPGLTLYQAILRDELAPLVSMTMDYLVKAVLRLNTEAVRGRNLDKEGRAAFRKAFRLGCSARIRQRLMQRLAEMMTQDSVAKTSTGSTALVIVNHIEKERQELQLWMENEGFKFKETRARGPRKLDAEGYHAGVAAGDKVSLDAQVSGKKSVDEGRRLK